jgi:hypothetical protein
VGDEVLTAGGIVGHVIDIDGDRVTLETSVGASFVVLRQYVLRKLVDPTVDEPEDEHYDEDHDSTESGSDDADEGDEDEDDHSSDDDAEGDHPSGQSGPKRKSGTGDDSSDADGPPII